MTDLRTRGGGTGEAAFTCIACVAMAFDGHFPGTASANGNERTRKHPKMWLSDLTVAQAMLNNPALTGAPFQWRPAPA